MARKEKQFHYLYKITNTKNNKYYIGMHSTDNLDDGYMGGGNRIRNSIRKHGKEIHEKEILEFYNSREELANMEREVVNLDLISYDQLCMNLCVGGQGGWPNTGKAIGGDRFKRANEVNKTEEGNKKIRKSISISMKKKWEDLEFKKDMLSKINLTFEGKSHTRESKEMIGKANSVSQAGDKNSQFGKLWIKNDLLMINKRINPDELDNYINSGFSKGMNMKYFKK
jgi:hypothetical protein